MRIRSLGMAAVMVLSSLVAVGAVAPAQAAQSGVKTAVRAATVKADARCTRVGQTITVRSTQYRCTKSGTSAKWVVNTKTVRAGRGCTFAGETASLSTASLFSCYKKSGRLIWKKATADCKEGFDLWKDLDLKYATNLAQLTKLEASVKTLPTDQQQELALTISIIKTNLQTIKATADDMKDTTLVMCSF